MLFGGALTTLLTRGLGQVEHLEVASPQAANKFWDQDVSWPEIAKSLAVEHLVWGEVDVVDEQATIDIQLVTSAGIQLYGETISRPISELFELQEKISSTVLDRLEIHLNDLTRERMITTGTKSAAAFIENRKAAAIINSGRIQDLEEAVEYARHALELDPSYEGAYRCMLVAFVNMSPYIGVERNKAMRKQVDQIAKDLLLKMPGSKVAALAQFVQTSLSNDRTTQVAQLVNLIKSNPGKIIFDTSPSPEIYMRFSQFLGEAGLYNEAHLYAQAYTGARGRPELAVPWLQSYYVNGGYEGAIRRRKEVLALNHPGAIAWMTGLITDLAMIGKFDEAQSYLEELKIKDRHGIWAYAAQYSLLAVRGDMSFGDEHYQEFVANPIATDMGRGHIAFLLGEVHSGIDYWRHLSPPEMAAVTGSLQTMEVHYGTLVTGHPDYTAFKERLGMGDGWKAYLATKVRELEPVTGIGLVAQNQELAQL